MAFLQNGTINNTISWVSRDSSNNEVTVLDQGEIDYSRILTSGTGVGQANSVHYASGLLTSGITQQFDLFSLNRPLFGSTLTTNFSGGKVKVLNIENLTSGLLLHFITTGSNAFSGTLMGGSGLTIMPLSYLSMIDLSGFNITTGNRYFYLKNFNNTGVSYQISILGNTL